MRWRTHWRATEAFDKETADKIIAQLEEGQKEAYENYSELIDSGLAREIARINLPLSLYTEFYWEMDLHNLFHFLKLRLDSHAQYEIRVYAQVILEMCRKVAPMATESFINHMNQGVSFSGEEMRALRDVMEGKPNPLEGKKLDRFNEKIRTGVQL